MPFQVFYCLIFFLLSFSFSLHLCCLFCSGHQKEYCFYLDFSLHNIEITKCFPCLAKGGLCCVYCTVLTLHICLLFPQVSWGLCYLAMLSLVRAARQQLGRAFGVRAQWLKPLPCTGAAHTCGKHWRGDKRLVAFSFH